MKKGILTTLLLAAIGMDIGREKAESTSIFVPKRVENSPRVQRIIAESPNQQFLKGLRRQAQYNRTLAGLVKV